MIRKLLCRLGLHYWNLDHYYGRMQRECIHCGKQQRIDIMQFRLYGTTDWIDVKEEQ